MMLKRIFLLLTAWCVCTQVPAGIKVACIGDSVTYGYGLSDRENEAYPARLQQLLGEAYEVRNFGHSGATLLNHGHRPYRTLPEYAQALAFVPDLVVIHLGLNDTDPRDWPDWSEDFIPDYRALIEDFRKVNSQVRIWICRMSPILHGHRRFLSGTRDWHAQIQRRIDRIAATDKVGLIDLYAPLIDRPDLLPDNLHPNAEGAAILAKTVFRTLTGDFGGLQAGPVYTDGMVLQRDKPLRITGIADAGEQIRVELRQPSVRKNRKTASMLRSGVAVASAMDGRWRIEFPGLPAGGPYELEMRAPSRTLVFRNVWVGEVWICTGQSNMAFEVHRQSTAEEDIRDADNHPRVHLYSMDENWRTDNVAWPRTALDSCNRLTYFRMAGWKECTSETVRDFSAVDYHFGRTLADSLGCPVGLIDCAVGGSTAESWTDAEALRWKFPEMLDDWNNGDFGQEWARERAKKNISAGDNPLQRHPYQPGYLFSAAFKRIDRYGIRGVLWYQGESNAHCIETHEKLFPILVESWRTCWGERIPVETVQLSGINRPSWPGFRDSQRRLAERLEGVGMTVCSDLGHPTDVHPRDKKPVGERACRSALHNVYGWPVVPGGPIYKGFVAEGAALRLSFDFAEGMTVTTGFELAGADGVYHPAEAVVEGNEIVVSSPAVKEPEAVRYAWKPYPVDADLVNATGIPCSTFRDERFSAAGR